MPLYNNGISYVKLILFFFLTIPSYFLKSIDIMITIVTVIINELGYPYIGVQFYNQKRLLFSSAYFFYNLPEILLLNLTIGVFDCITGTKSMV